jgi:D-alanyl-lipoteichoic acid acyltransferase DltB (MBOAT superfamily)
MTFASFNFLLFFPLVVILFNLIPQRGKVWFLLVASYFFYINLQPVYALLLALVTGSTYLFTKGIYETKSDIKKHKLLIWGIIVVILPLFFFKYFGFINNSIFELLNHLGLHLSLPKISFILPIGISFYTFMAIGYLVDVYNEDVDFEKSIGSTGLFLSFFPIILSGPIERAGNMFPQFKKLQNSTYDDLVSGAKLMLWGYFMKLCVADRLGIYVDAVYTNIPFHNGTTLAFATVLYPFQVYADLGGYTLIAIGVARCLGIKVIPNFKRPFFATSMSEFWRRWHMSLIQWLTDYIYTPLSFNLRSWKMWGIVSALMLTFMISGIWHGAALTFIIWGLVQGVYLSIEAAMHKQRTEITQKFRLNNKPWYIFISCVWVFVLFSFSQIFGKCNNVRDAFEVIGKITGKHGGLYMDKTTLSFGLFALFILLIKDFRDEFFPGKMLFFENRNIVVRYLSYALILILILAIGVLDSGQFIYFQF